MEEQVVLVNDFDEPIETLEKSKVHTANTPLHRGFSVFIFGAKGQVLLQQRALGKTTWPGVWSNSCCGHPKPGEKNIDAVRRRLAYELSLNNVEIYEILPHYRYRCENNGIWENEICPVFVGFTEQNPIINKGEVESTRFMPWFKFVKDVNDHPEAYSFWCGEETKLINKNKRFLQLYKDFYDEKNKR